MPELSGLGKTVIVLGGVIVALGILLVVAGKWPAESGWFGWLGRLPGDILIKRDSFTFYFPFSTGLLISVVLSLLLYLMSHLSGR